MKKIGILTINDYANYGNRLQNYAVQEVLKELGHKPTTIVNKTSLDKSDIRPESSSNGKSLSGMIRVLKRKLYNGINRNKIKELKKEKRRRFKVFSDIYITETDYEISVDAIPEKLNEAYDYFVTGSDQVWNPYFKHFSEIDFLTFASPVKRVAFSPSFGISTLPQSVEKDFKKWISGMATLSVREEAGAHLIESLTGRKPEVLIDPTMFLNKKQWGNIAKPSPVKPKKKFLCTYFLGETYIEYKDTIQKIARQFDLEIVNLGNLYDLERFTVDPSEFLDFIASSEIFLTDSFHGTIFSILFEKPFIVFERTGKLPSMNSRIDTILSKFQLEERKWDKMEHDSTYFDIDYRHVSSILENERGKVVDYLTKSLKNK